MSIQRLTTWGGDYHANTDDLEIEDGNFFGFTVVEDGTTIDVMTGGPIGNISNTPTDYASSSETNVSGKELSAGTLITISLGEIIKNFKCTGAVVLHRESKK